MEDKRLKEIEEEVENWNDLNWRVDIVYELIEEIKKLKGY